MAIYHTVFFSALLESRLPKAYRCAEARFAELVVEIEIEASD